MKLGRDTTETISCRLCKWVLRVAALIVASYVVRKVKGAFDSDDSGDSGDSAGEGVLDKGRELVRSLTDKASDLVRDADGKSSSSSEPASGGGGPGAQAGGDDDSLSSRSSIRTGSDDPDPAGLRNLSREELYDLAKDLGIPDRATMTQEELARAVNEFDKADRG